MTFAICLHCCFLHSCFSSSEPTMLALSTNGTNSCRIFKCNGLKRLCLSATFCSRFSPLGAIWWRQYVREFCFPINVLVHQVTCRCCRFSGLLCRKCRGFSSSHQAISDGTKRSTVVLRQDLCVFCRNHDWIPSSP